MKKKKSINNTAEVNDLQEALNRLNDRNDKVISPDELRISLGCTIKTT
jgi:hypothetical protein